MDTTQRLGGKELKFVAPAGRAEQVREWARRRMDADAHAQDGDGYRIESLYFDTPSFEVYRRVGSYARAKFRVRRYDGAEAVFLERKLKTRTVVAKRRSLVRLSELALLRDSDSWDWEGEWFRRRLESRGLQAVCAISYKRTARVGVERGEAVRLTVDEGLQARPVDGLEFGAPGRPLFGDGRQIVELKFTGEMPRLFKALLREIPLGRCAISKYRASARALGLAEIHV